MKVVLTHYIHTYKRSLLQGMDVPHTLSCMGSLPLNHLPSPAFRATRTYCDICSKRFSALKLLNQRLVYTRLQAVGPQSLDRIHIATAAAHASIKGLANGSELRLTVWVMKFESPVAALTAVVTICLSEACSTPKERSLGTVPFLRPAQRSA